MLTTLAGLMQRYSREGREDQWIAEQRAAVYADFSSARKSDQVNHSKLKQLLADLDKRIAKAKARVRNHETLLARRDEENKPENRATALLATSSKNDRSQPGRAATHCLRWSAVHTIGSA